MKKNRVVLIIAIAVALLGVLSLCAIFALPVLIGPAVERTFTGMMAVSGEDFLQALAAEDYLAAYTLCTSDLQSVVESPGGLAEMFSAVPTLDSWDYKTRRVEVEEEGDGYTATMTVMVLEGEVIFADGQSDSLRIVLYPKMPPSSEEGIPYRVEQFSVGPVEAAASQ
jgi:hypothetical protein